MSQVEMFNNLVLLASADGRFTEEEVKFLVQKAESWNISADEVESALAGASTGEAEIVVPTGEQARREMLKEMIRLMAVDGHLAEEEKRICAMASAAMELNTIEFDEIIQSILEG